LKYGDLESRSPWKKWERLQEIRESDPWELEKKYGVNDLPKYGIKSLKAIEDSRNREAYWKGLNEGMNTRKAAEGLGRPSDGGYVGNAETGRPGKNWDDEFSPDNILK